MSLFASKWCRKIAPPCLFIQSFRFFSQNVKPTSQSTIDESEINFHSNLSKEWWDEKGTLKVLHAMNTVRTEFIRSGLINSGLLKEETTHSDPVYLKGIKIADVGCGGGILSLRLASLGCEVIGLEPSQELVKVAKDAVGRLKPVGKTEFLAMSVEDYAEKKSGNLDAVVCSEVIEHVSQKDTFIEACVKIIKPGGSIFFTTPNRTLVGKFLTIYAAEYLLGLIPKGTHHYEKFITPDELSQILSKNSCETKMVNGFMYFPLNNSFYWTSSKHLFYALHAVKKK